MDFWSFMGGIVVNNEVKLAVAIIAECGVYAFQKGQKFLVTVALVASAQNSSGGRIISGKQSRDAHNRGFDARADQDAAAKWVGCAPGLRAGSSHRDKARWLYLAD